MWPEGRFCLLIYVLQRKPIPLQGSCATFHPFAKSWTLIKVQYLVCNYILATAYFFLASLRKQSQGSKSRCSWIILNSNSRWQDFTWKCTRLTQHLFLLTSHFYDQRFWSLPPLLSRKNSTFELHGKRRLYHLRENTWFASAGMQRRVVLLLLWG